MVEEQVRSGLLGGSDVSGDRCDDELLVAFDHLRLFPPSSEFRDTFCAKGEDVVVDDAARVVVRLTVSISSIPPIGLP